MVKNWGKKCASVVERAVDECSSRIISLQFKCEAISQVEKLRQIKALTDCPFGVTRGYEVESVESLVFVKCFGVLLNLVKLTKTDIDSLADYKLIDAKKSMHRENEKCHVCVCNLASGCRQSFPLTIYLDLGQFSVGT